MSITDKQMKEFGFEVNMMVSRMAVIYEMEQVVVVGIRRDNAYLLAQKQTRSDAEIIKDKKLAVKCLDDYFIRAREVKLK